MIPSIWTGRGRCDSARDRQENNIRRRRKNADEYWGQHWTAWARLSAVNIVPRSLVLAGAGCARWRHEAGAAVAGAAWERPRHTNTKACQSVPLPSKKLPRAGGGRGWRRRRQGDGGTCAEHAQAIVSNTAARIMMFMRPKRDYRLLNMSNLPGPEAEFAEQKFKKCCNAMIQPIGLRM